MKVPKSMVSRVCEKVDLKPGVKTEKELCTIKVMMMKMM